MLVHSSVTIINHIQAMQFAQSFLGLHATALQGVDLVQRFQHHRSICGLCSDPGLGSDIHLSSPDSLNMSGVTLGVSLPKPHGKSVSFSPFYTSVKLDLSKIGFDGQFGSEVILPETIIKSKKEVEFLFWKHYHVGSSGPIRNLF